MISGPSAYVAGKRTVLAPDHWSAMPSIIFLYVVYLCLLGYVLAIWG